MEIGSKHILIHAYVCFGVGSYQFMNVPSRYSPSNTPAYAIWDRNKQIHYKFYHEIRMTCEHNMIFPYL